MRSGNARMRPQLTLHCHTKSLLRHSKFSVVPDSQAHCYLSGAIRGRRYVTDYILSTIYYHRFSGLSSLRCAARCWWLVAGGTPAHPDLR